MRVPDRVTLRVLVSASRPAQLALVVAVYALGVAIALHRTAFAPVDVAVGAGALVPTAASIHYANEYTDHETDAITTPTLVSGGSGALRRSGRPRALVLRAALGSLALGVVVTVAGALTGHLSNVAVWLLVVGAVFGWQYSVGPLALSWRGLGELDNALLGGVVLPVYGHAVAFDRIVFDAVLVVLPFAVLVFANLLATQWPDREADAAVGKRTLAVRLPPRRLRLLHAVCVVATFAGLAVATAGGLIPRVVGWSGLAALPFAVWGVVAFARERSPIPTVVAMVVLAAAHLLAWLVAA